MEPISVGKAKALQAQENRRRKEKNLVEAAKKERAARDAKIAAEVARIGADDGKKKSNQALSQDLDTSGAVVVYRFGDSLSPVDELNLSIKKEELDNHGSSSAEQSASDEDEEQDGSDEENEICHVTLLRQKLEKTNSSTVENSDDEFNDKVGKPLAKTNKQEDAGEMNSNKADKKFRSQSPGKHNKVVLVSSKRSAKDDGGSSKRKIAKIGKTLKNSGTDPSLELPVYKEIFENLTAIYEQLRQFRLENPTDKGRNRLKKYYEHVVRGLGCALEVVLRSEDSSDLDMKVLEQKKTMKEFDYYHHLAASFYKHSSQGLQQLATGMVKIAVMARNQIRVVRLANSCESCQIRVKKLV